MAVLRGGEEGGFFALRCRAGGATVAVTIFVTTARTFNMYISTRSAFRLEQERVEGYEGTSLIDADNHIVPAGDEWAERGWGKGDEGGEEGGWTVDGEATIASPRAACPLEASTSPWRASSPSPFYARKATSAWRGDRRLGLSDGGFGTGRGVA